jgi:hypothetical protein
MPTAKDIPSQPPTELTFEHLAELEPRLELLAEICRNYRKKPLRQPFCANEIWYEILKPQLLRLVGWTRRPAHDVLSSSDAYDIAYNTLYRHLPDCSHDGMCWG